MRKVGVITMHKVPNYGSALQAYALQNKIDSLGFDAEIIDYCYPNHFHCMGQGIEYYPPRKMIRLWLLFLAGKLILLLGMNSKRKKAEDAILRFQLQKNFRKFYRKFFKLSRFYGDEKSIRENVPSYDIYMTGSDQVWNPKFIVGDSNFLLGFAPEEKPRLSYAASFSARTIKETDEPFFKKYLEKYGSISVREKSGVDVVAHLIGTHADVVCDPTLLLDRKEWLRLCPPKTLMKDKYLLLYIQSYSYDPYPNIVTFTKNLSKKLGLQVVILMGLSDGYSIEGASCFKDAGPIEFLQLFRDANLVVTTSFHGTAFALNFKKEFYSVVKKIEDNDSRIVDFLRLCGAVHHLIEIENAVSAENLPLAITDEKEMEGLKSFREKSMTWLRKNLLV